MKDDKLLAPAREILETYLRQKGMRRTPERFALLEKVFSTGDHFYVDVLCEAMELEGYHVSKSTVYAAMQLFLDAGLVRRHQFGNQPAQFERCLPGVTRNHLHLVCSRCGRVREIRENQYARELASRRYPGFTPDCCAIYVYGLCARCTRQK